MRTIRTAALIGLFALTTPVLAQAASDSIYVDVQNERSATITVYLKTGHFDRRLAEVAPNQSKTVTVPTAALEGRSGVTLLVHVEGEDDIGLRAYTVRSGDRLTLTVPAAGKLPPTPEDTMSTPLTPEEATATTITVDNQQARKVTVYAERSQYAIRLGVVPARERATLTIPQNAVGQDKSVRIFVHPEGGQDLASSLLYIKKGEHLGLKVPKY